jgi:hypothetical protein
MPIDFRPWTISFPVPIKGKIEDSRAKCNPEQSMPLVIILFVSQKNDLPFVKGWCPLSTFVVQKCQSVTKLGGRLGCSQPYTTLAGNFNRTIIDTEPDTRTLHCRRHHQSIPSHIFIFDTFTAQFHFQRS